MNCCRPTCPLPHPSRSSGRRSLLPATLRVTRCAGKLSISCRCRLLIVEAFQSAALHLFAKNTFDATHHILVFTDYKRECIAGLRGAASAADPVRVCISGVGHVIVDDMRYTRDIDASGRDIRLEIDGGVKVDNIRRVADAGADTFVAGSAIFGQPSYKAVIDAMRAELAAQMRDFRTAREWAIPVVILWEDADPFLRPLVGRMKQLSGS